MRKHDNAEVAALVCACLVAVEDGCLLSVRVRDNPHWYLPGGKIEPGEQPRAAVVREIREELGVELWLDSLRYVTTVLAPAYDQPRDVELVCFSGHWHGVVRPRAEVSDVAWLPVAQPWHFAPAVRMLCRRLRRR